MEDEIQQEQEQDYIQTIADLKANTVPKEKYQKLKDENKRLLDSVINGTTIDVQAPTAEKVDVNALRKKLFSGDLNNLQYAETALKLRKAILEESGEDIMLPNGKDYEVTPEDQQAVQNLVDAFEHCIDVADGDNTVFNREMGRVMKDNPASVIASRTKNIRR